ncbi:MAG: putative Na+/H+ antiporter [Vicinamibacterales bacterium]
MSATAEVAASFPRALSSYPDPSGDTLIGLLIERARLEPFNVVATLIFLLAIAHTFSAARFTKRAHARQHAADARARAAGLQSRPSVSAELLHFLGEVEVVFGLWAIVLLVVAVAYVGWEPARHYFNDGVNYTEPLFVVVVMGLAATRPIVGFAEAALRRVASLGRGTPAAWWMAILIVGPLLGSFITEPAAMTISALLLGRQFYDLEPSSRLKYATLGLLFVNVSIGGTLTHFAAPPVLMVARPWDWDLPFMLAHFGWRACLAILMATLGYFLVFRRELSALAKQPAAPDTEEPDETSSEVRGLLPVPAWITVTHAGFMVWTVLTAHYPALFIGGFLIFLGFAKATSAYQSQTELRTPLLVGFFLAGLVIHGGLQGWWIAPVLARLAAAPLFLSAAVLTAFNDNALITYLATLVPDLTDSLKIAVVQGAVTGGGLTVIANAPNPAGQALLGRFFGGAISPFGLLLAALPATILAALFFRLL